MPVCLPSTVTHNVSKASDLSKGFTTILNPRHGAEHFDCFFAFGTLGNQLHNDVVPLEEFPSASGHRRARHTTSQWLLEKRSATNILTRDQDQQVAKQHDVAYLHMLQLISKRLVLGTTL